MTTRKRKPKLPPSATPPDETEQWLPVPGFDGYEASDLGRVRSWRVPGHLRCRRQTPLVLTPHLSKGYLRVTMQKEGRASTQILHAVVLRTFKGPCPEGMVGCHDPDPTRTNCRLENLRWDTPKNNAADRDRHGRTARGAATRPETRAKGDKNGMRLHPGSVPRGEANGMSKLTEAAVLEMRRIRVSGETFETIGKMFGVTKSTAAKAVKGLLWRHAS